MKPSILFSSLLIAVSSSSASYLGKRATCTPASAGNLNTDDVPAITAAVKSCGNGGTILFPAGRTYSIRTPLDFGGCVGCTIQLEGTLKVSDDTSYWDGRQACIVFKSVTGATFKSVTGSGTVDGNGQKFWDVFATNTAFNRPTLVQITKSKQITVTNIKFINAPNVFHVVTGSSTDVTYSRLTLSAISTSANRPKNTDGFDVNACSNVVISDCTVLNDDDCVAFKPGADHATITNIACTGSHGISVGSLGQKAGSTDSVTNVYVKGAMMKTSTKAVGIKLWEGGSAHGVPFVKNVTFDTVTVDGCDYAAQIQTCYNSDSAASCAQNPSTATIDQVYFKNFSGTLSGKYKNVVASLNCPAKGTCNLFFSNFNPHTPTSVGTILCSNLNNAKTGITCSGPASG